MGFGIQVSKGEWKGETMSSVSRHYKYLRTKGKQQAALKSLGVKCPYCDEIISNKAETCIHHVWDMRKERMKRL